MDEPHLFADEAGVWREDTPGRRFGIGWEEIYCVSASLFDEVTTVSTVVVLDFDYGHFLELYAHWPGFSEVMAAIEQRLPGIDPDWRERLEQAGANGSVILLWQRSEEQEAQGGKP